MAKPKEERDQKSSVEGEGGGEIAHPWSKCIMGCKLKEGAEVIMLQCFHVICSDKCSSKFLSEVIPGSAIECRICRVNVTRVQLSNKIIPQNEFLPKVVPKEPELICEQCVYDRTAKAYCAECPANLCDQCAALHPGLRATQKHVLQFDLTEQIEKQRAKEQDEATKCTLHKTVLLTHVCRTCTKKICEKCIPDHGAHVIIDVQKEKEELASNLVKSRHIMRRFDAALVEINKKRQEIVTTGWDNVMSDIDDQFATMIEVLLRRQKEIRREAKFRFKNQLSVLRSNVHSAQLAKSSMEQYVKTGEIMLNDMDDLASLNFLRHSDEYLQWLNELEKRVTQGFDRFVDKGWHFQVDSSANIQAQKYLKEYCQVEYSYQPRIPKVTVKTYSGAKKLVKADNALNPVETPDARKVAVNNNNTVENSNGSLRLRRIAVKSTGGAFPRTYSKKDMGTQFKATPPSPSPNTSQAASSNQAEASSPNSPRTPTIPSRQSARRRQDGNSSAFIGLEIIADPPTHCESSDNTDVESKIVGTVEAMESDSDSKTSLRIAFPPDAVEGEEKVTIIEKAKRGPKPKSKSSEGGFSGAGSLEKTKTTDPDVDSSQTSSTNDDAGGRDSETSTEPCTPTSVSESPERGFGKRERKKKSFPPGFVGSDQSWKQVRKQEAEVAAAATRLKWKARLSKAGSGSTDAKMPRLQPEIADDGSAKVTDELDHENVDAENCHEYESSDGYASEPGTSTRRQSLRRRTIQKESAKELDQPKQEQETMETDVEVPPSSDDDDPLQKRGKKIRKTEPVSNVADEVDFSLPEAPLSSIEEPPELCDFPVQGQGIMKIRHEDDNDDYCCICLDGGEIIVCCDYCPKVFHLSCHIPILQDVPDGDENEKWRCNYDTTKEMIYEIISKYPYEEESENRMLSDANKRHFIVACKFLMECYKISEIPTMRWKFPSGYLLKYGKVPYHLKYIKERLCSGVPTHFAGVQDMLLSFKQMFIQALAYYKKDKYQPYARTCFEKFTSLVSEFYPEHQALFESLE